MGCNTSKESVQPAVDEAKEGDSAKNGGERSSISICSSFVNRVSNIQPIIMRTFTMSCAR